MYVTVDGFVPIISFEKDSFVRKRTNSLSVQGLWKHFSTTFVTCPLEFCSEIHSDLYLKDELFQMHLHSTNVLEKYYLTTFTSLKSMKKAEIEVPVILFAFLVLKSIHIQSRVLAVARYDVEAFICVQTSSR
ncbi:hypothetical protein CEXT_517561, partial [Caerostris extrusa]